MKFCKNLQRVMEIADPEWAPYWLNYKQLKKLIKALVPPSSSAAEHAGDNTRTNNAVAESRTARESGGGVRRQDSAGSESGRDARRAGATMARDAPPREAAPAAAAAAAAAAEAGGQQSQGDETSERRQTRQRSNQPVPAPAPQQETDIMNALGRSPGEKAFFKLLHSEVKKATRFFEQAQKEYTIREERVRNGMEIVKSEIGERLTGDGYYMAPVEERWSRLAQSIFRLYRELLLLETFAIMTYCGFSKILKKHDKNTGFSTRNAFMAKIVNHANFVNYPQVLEMINRCEQLYEEVSNRLVQQGKSELHQDERLFIHMINRLNHQVTEGGQPNYASPEGSNLSADSQGANQALQAPAGASPLAQEDQSWKAQSLKELVAENDANQLPPGAEDDSDSDADVNAKLKAVGPPRKRIATTDTDKESSQDKRPRES